jgi:hypothetical protein
MAIRREYHPTPSERQGPLREIYQNELFAEGNATFLVPLQCIKLVHWWVVDSSVPTCGKSLVVGGLSCQSRVDHLIYKHMSPGKAKISTCKHVRSSDRLDYHLFDIKAWAIVSRIGRRQQVCRQVQVESV